jgi:hypothetical protein
MSELLLSRDLLAFQLFYWLRIDADAAVDKQTTLAVIEMAARLATDAFSLGGI